MKETFETQPETRWRFFTDTVMGGVSSGQVRFLSEGTESFARMTGTVSTENKGGFIQARMELPGPLPKDTAGLRLVVRGNNQTYYVHLRTAGTVLPWQYYQAAFEATGDWSEVRLKLNDFRPSGALLRNTPKATGIKSVGIVAYGRDHTAEIDVREIEFY